MYKFCIKIKMWLCSSTFISWIYLKLFIFIPTLFFFQFLPRMHNQKTKYRPAHTCLKVYEAPITLSWTDGHSLSSTSVHSHKAEYLIPPQWPHMLLPDTLVPCKCNQLYSHGFMGYGTSAVQTTPYSPPHCRFPLICKILYAFLIL